MAAIESTILASQYLVDRTDGWDTGWRTLPLNLFETPEGDGGWWIHTEAQRIFVRSGECFVITAGMRHRLLAEGMFRSTWIYAEWTIDGLPVRFAPEARPMSQTESDAVKRCADAIAQSEVPFATMLAQHANGLQLLRAVSDLVIASRARDSRLARALKFAREHFAGPLTRKDLARVAGLSEARLHELCVQETGVAPMSYVLRLRLRHSAALLSQTDATVAEIAVRSGFESVYYFSRFFKKHTGCSPTAFRQRLGW